MERLCPEDKLDYIRQLVKEHNITAFELSKGAAITFASAKCIVSGRVYKPQQRTLNVVLGYLKGRFASGVKTNIVPVLLSQIAEKDRLIKLLEEKNSYLERKCKVCAGRVLANF